MNDRTKDDSEDEDLLRTLGAQARQNRRERIEQALGDWGEGRIDAQHALSKAGVDAQDAHAELFAPLREEARDRITAQALVHLAPASPERAAGSVPPRQRRSRWVNSLFGGGALVAVAAAAAWLLWARPPQPLPGYALAVEGGDLAERGAGEGAPGLSAPPGVRVLSGQSTLTVALRPLTPVSGALEARLYVRPAAGRMVPSPVSPEISPAGAVRWRGTAQQLAGGMVGDLVLQAVVGRPGTLPEPAVLTSTPSQSTPGVARFETAIRLVDEPLP